MPGPGLAGLLALFAVAAIVVVAAGIVLARDGDTIAERTGMGGLVVGLLLVAGATSLPEVATNVAAALADAPDLAVGDLFGSSMANMAILAVVDLVHRGRVWTRVGLDQARIAAAAIVLTCIAVLGILVPSGVAIGWVGVDTILMVIIYFAATRWIRRTRYRGRRHHDGTGEFIAPTGWGLATTRGQPYRAVVLRFAIAAVVILVAAPLLAVSAEGIADETGIGQTFIGAVLLAWVTSLPELVASLTAVRIGAHDLAVGNLFGSNAFNMVSLIAADLAYRPGPILAAVDPNQVVAGVGAILLMGMAVAAVIHGTETRLAQLEPDAVAVLIAYVALLGAVWVAVT